MSSKPTIVISTRPQATRKFCIGLARAFGGAIFFSLPLLMTMEMWWLGFHIDPFRLLVLMLAMVPVLIGLDHYAGFEETASWWQDAIDGIVAYGVGLVAAAAVLLLFNVVTVGMAWDEIVGKVALQAVPASFGAVIATAQLGGDSEEEEERRERAGYCGELFFMAIGAIFFAFNLAPTEEMLLIAFKMTPVHALVLIVASLAMMHGFVYAVSFRGAPVPPEGATAASLFLRFTVVGYALALALSAYVLWTFGRLTASGWTTGAMTVVVLAFPASLGAAAARLILGD